MDTTKLFKSLYRRLAWIPLVTIANICIICSTIYKLTHDDHTEEIAAILSDIGKNNAFLTKEAVPCELSNNPIIVEIDNLQDSLLLLRSRIAAININPDEGSNARQGVMQCAIEIFKIHNLLNSLENFTRIFPRIYSIAKYDNVSSLYLVNDADFWVIIDALSKSNMEKYMQRANINMPDQKKRKEMKSMLTEEWVLDFLEAADLLTLRGFKYLNLMKKEYVFNSKTVD